MNSASACWERILGRRPCLDRSQMIPTYQRWRWVAFKAGGYLWTWRAEWKSKTHWRNDVVHVSNTYKNHWLKSTYSVLRLFEWWRERGKGKKEEDKEEREEEEEGEKEDKRRGRRRKQRKRRRGGRGWGRVKENEEGKSRLGRKDKGEAGRWGRRQEVAGS